MTAKENGAKRNSFRTNFFKKRRSKLHKRTMATFVIYASTCFLLGFLTYRVAFDLRMFFCGATFEIRGVSRSGYDYLLRLPRGYSVFSGKRPLLIYLHGAGETGKDVSDLKMSEPSAWACDYVDKADYPFITVVPVTSTYGWNSEQLKVLTEELLLNRSRFAVDESRVYLTGYSIGGFGVFETAEKYPEQFAAIAPVAGGGNVEQASRLKETPTWAFHGDADLSVPYSCSKEIIDAARACGNEEARLTTFRNAGHGIVVDVYRNPQLYRWLLSFKR